MPTVTNNSYTNFQMLPAFKPVKCIPEVLSSDWLSRHRPPLIGILFPGGYPCRRCGKCYRRKEHFFRHRGECGKPARFNCVLCAGCFTRRDSLGRHLVRIHGQQPPKEPDSPWSVIHLRLGWMTSMTCAFVDKKKWLWQNCMQLHECWTARNTDTNCCMSLEI